MKSIFAIALVLTLAACSSSSTPAAPKLGAVVDRMGRAAVNTALSNPFELVSGSTADQAKDAYNAEGTPANWGTKFQAEIATNLAVLDALDATCGNQLGAGSTAAAGRYNTLASVLADDQLYVNTASTSCGIYLGVEADAVGLAPGNGDCGGRTPVENAIDSTYQVLAAGTICALSSSVCAISNGITSDAEGGANATGFPFLGAAN